MSTVNRHTSRRVARIPAVARPSALLTRMMVSINRWLRGWWQRWLDAVLRWHKRPGEELPQVRQPLTCEPLEPRILLSSEFHPGIQAVLVTSSSAQALDVSAPATINLTPLVDADGTQVTLAITGPGTAQLVSDGAGFALKLNNTDASTQVSLAANGGDGRVVLTGISVRDNVGALDLAVADLQGDATFSGTLRTLVLGDIRKSRLDIAGASDIALQAGRIVDSQLHAPLARVSVVASDWLAGIPGASRLELAGLSSLSTSGDFAADLHVSGQGVPVYALGSVRVGGGIVGGMWSIHGRGSVLQAGSTSRDWCANLTGTLVQFISKGDASGSLSLAALQMLQVGGSARGFTLLVGADLGDDCAPGGVGANADSYQAGTLARVRISGDLIDSRLLVGLDPVNAVFGDGNDQQLGSPTQRLQEFIVGGQVTDSTVVAPAFPSAVRIAGTSLAPGSLGQVFASVSADSVAPLLSARLLDDTGSVSDDGLTRDPAVVVEITEAGVLSAIEANLDNSADFLPVSAALQSDGSYLINARALAELSGSRLPDGAYTLSLRARDAAGNVAEPVTVRFTLDTSAPALGQLALDPASDSGALGDLSTTAEIVTLIGQSTAGAAIELAALGLSTTADETGAFSFTNLALALGSNRFDFTASDAAGNRSTASLEVERTELIGDTAAPTLSAALANDSGTSNSDRVTNDPTIIGQTGDDVGVTQLLVAVDPTGTPDTTDLSGLIQPDGSFTLSAGQLASLAAGVLADGEHSVLIQALDAAGNATEKTVSFTLDTAAPAAATFAIAAADAFNGDDSQTSASRVVLRGQAPAGAVVTLGAQGLSTLAGQTGSFQLANVGLVEGDNLLSLTIADAAGNTLSVARTLTRVTATHSDAVLDWNAIALEAIKRDVTDPPVATRVLAIQSLAVFDTLAAIEGTPAYLVQRTVNGPISISAAVAQAAYRVLSQLYPAQRASFDAALQTSLAGVPEGAARTAGIALGQEIADAVLAIRAADGYRNFITDDGSTAIGKWRPTGPAFLTAEDPQWSYLAPFALSSGDAFRAPPPPALDSLAYAQALEEVRSLGSATSITRSADQTEQALFWADGGGSLTPPGHWSQIASQVAREQGNSLSANARLLAQVNVALADAAIACWDTKYAYDFWRPETAIHNAGADGNAGTAQDASWRPLLISPAHPDYVSGHSTFSAAAAEVLAATFGDAVSFTTTSSTLPGVTRSYGSFSQAAAEAGASRVYGGIHTSFADLAGRELGKQVAVATLARFSLNQDTQAPTIVASKTPAATNSNLTLSGQILDNLSGVAGAQWRLDNGELQELAVAANGGFSISTAFALDGSADGVHTLTVLARDVAGNLSAAYTRSFILDTQAPTLSLSSLQEGASLTGNSRLTGIADAAGSALTLLSYRLDSGPLRSLIFDSDGAFDAALAFAGLDIGSHTLILNASDAAGNSASLTRTVKVDALAAFTVVSVTPASGAQDVGVTFRPQVNFSRAVNTATLTADSLYATAPDGSKIAASIVPALDGSFAWLFFTKPLPGASQITLHVNGSAIRAQQDGAFLDADGNGTGGGLLTSTFSTVSRTAVAGTRLVGKVVDPGPDLQPMTFDDIGRGADGIIHTPDDVFLLPIAHAKVYVLGQEDRFVFTDADGNFTLDGVPAGTVKVAVDGRTASNAPSGVFFPEMVMDVELLPGVTNTLMGGMGSVAKRLANIDRREVYLPRVPTSALQAVSDTATTVITLTDAASAPQLTEQQRAGLTLTVNPGSAIGENGEVLQDVQIGISTVPPELVRDMLPPGVLQHSFDITIQAPGVATFAEPVEISFPNVFAAAPGTKLNILSFDHTTGRLVINGTGTVSADGLTVVSDPGSGIRAPGWHSMTQPGNPVRGPADPPPPPPCDEDAKSNPLDNMTFWSDSLADILECASSISETLRIIRNVYTVMNDSFGLVAELVDLVRTTKTAVNQGQPASVVLGFAKVAQTYKGKIVNLVEIVNQTVFEAATKWEIIVDCLGSALNIADRACGKLIDDPCEEISFFGEYACAAIEVANTSFDAAKLLYDRYTNELKSLVSYKAACFITENLISLIDDYLKQDQLQQPSQPLVAGRVVSGVVALAATTVSATFDDLLQQLQAIAVELPLNNATLNSNTLAFVGEASILTDSMMSVFPSSARLSTSMYGLPRQGFYLATYGDAEIRGNFEGGEKLDLFLPSNIDFAIRVFDPITGLIGAAYGKTPSSGITVTIPGLLQFKDAADADGDGLSDLAEVIIGTDVNSIDSDGDGISDRSEIDQGLDPLGGLALPLGVLAVVSPQGDVVAVAVSGTTDGGYASNAYLAVGVSGLAVVDTAAITSPRLLGEFYFSGNNVDIAVDGARKLAALAASEAGLHLVDISNPSAPKLQQTITLGGPVTGVVVRDGNAYAIYGTRVVSVDLNTGDIRQTLDLATLGGSTLVDIAIDGDTLYTIDASRTMRSVSISGDVLTPRGALTLAVAGGKIFVGGGVAYVGRDDGFSGGFSSVDVSDLDSLRLLSGVDANNIAGGAIAANGSGLAVAVGRPGRTNVLDVLSVLDPSNTANFVTRIDLPAAPKDVVLANGLAFVADGTGGLQIVNYAGFDTKRIAPNVSITANGVDVDPATPGIQVLEGRTVRVVPTVTDDVQVRNVELLVNGRVVANDVAFPWDLFAQAPSIALGGNTLTLQVRATDTGGNFALSNIVTLDVVPDTFAPQVVSVSVDEGARRFFVRSIEVTFDEPLDLARLNTSGVHLLRAGADASFGTADDVAVAVRLDTRSFGQSLSVLTSGLLPPGDYRLSIDPDIIADRAGNALDAAIVRHFSIRPASDVRALSGIAEISTAPSANPGQQIGIAVPFDPATARAELATVDGNGNLTTATLSATRWDSARGIAYFNVPINAVTGDAVVFSQVGSTRTDFADGSFPLQILPVIDGIDVQYLSDE
ncbi:Ig-like domain-containing protein, partial [Accumulibacter sp.]|uniref:Ig-like domain-containing protein n=1 Tax=Accumulibacter sp. TaxID=2053492 RepID=UPI002C8F464F